MARALLGGGCFWCTEGAYKRMKGISSALPAYAGGEMIVQTRNAGFGLVYMGANDGSGAVIPPAFRGWWLTEI